jgi:ArsR family transcriptional regulator
MAKQPYTFLMKTIRKSKEVFKKQAQVLKALAHESRLMIVDRLYEGEASAGELTLLVGSDQTTVSKHLAILRAHGIVESRREGNVAIYKLNTPCVVNFFSCAANVMKERTS